MVVVHQATLCLWRIKLTHLVAGISVVAQRLVAMSETLGHIECSLIVLVQLDRDMLQIGGTLGTKIHDNVEDSAPCAADKFGFSRRWILKMHAPYGSLLQV